MLRRLDKIRFRGQKRDDFLDIVESPNTSDTEGSDDLLVKPRSSSKDMEDLRDPVSITTAHQHTHHGCWMMTVCTTVLLVVVVVVFSLLYGLTATNAIFKDVQ